MIDKKYDPGEIEPKWCRSWEESGLFSPDSSDAEKTFCIVIPPPNVTGSLHIGHALVNTIQDLLIRRKRMAGFKTLWLPGTDHAGIATQMVVERELAAQGVKRTELGREKFVEKIWEWKEESGNMIFNQLRRIGASPDWSRTRFTMDEGLSRAVKKAFVEYYREGLIYRGEYLVNWCPADKTALSDLEVEYRETEGELTQIAYSLEGGEGSIEIATTRPETLLGDVAVAVNPEDERYRDFVGKTVIVPLVGRRIPVLADSHVDPAFGTGALKITPAHDPNDFEIGKRHRLSAINIFTEDAKINGVFPPLEGVDRFEARKRIVEMLKESGNFRSSKKHPHSVGHSQRRKSVIEPRLSTQWFCRMDGMAREVLRRIENGEFKVVPLNQQKILVDWLENIKDWCISRQLWWGHRIPAWHCGDCGELNVSEEDTVTRCEKCGSENLKPDEDVLDTWFSSGLFPFSTMGWPEETEDLRQFYPNSVLVTGYDIVFFWVARMLMMGVSLTGKLPFPEVFTHGLVRDEKGEKMSKTKGNVIDPLEIVEKHGADAMRFTLLSHTVMGADLKLDGKAFENGKFFINKMWNAMKFALGHLNRAERVPPLPETRPGQFEHWILAELDESLREINRGIDAYRFHDACHALYHFVWSQFCDWYIELCKSAFFRAGDEAGKEAALATLNFVCVKILAVAHPFIPFSTEEIRQAFPGAGKTLMTAEYPEALDASLFNADEARKAGRVIEFIKSVRKMRGENSIPSGAKIPLSAKIDDAELLNSLGERKEEVIALGGLSEFSLNPESPPNFGQPVREAGNGYEVATDSSASFDPEAERERLGKRRDKTLTNVAKIEAKLSKASFLEKAPEAVIAKNRKELEELREIIVKVEAALNSLPKP